jgi:hypothetical protein
VELVVRPLVSGVIIAVASEVARRFWPAMLLAAAVTAASYGIWVWAARRLGFELRPGRYDAARTRSGLGRTQTV